MVFSGTSSSVMAPRTHATVPPTQAIASAATTKLRSANASSTATRPAATGVNSALSRVLRRSSSRLKTGEPARWNSMPANSGPGEHRVHALEHAALGPARLRAEPARVRLHDQRRGAPHRVQQPVARHGQRARLRQQLGRQRRHGEVVRQQRRGERPEGAEGDVVGGVEARHVLDAVDLEELVGERADRREALVREELRMLEGDHQQLVAAEGGEVVAIGGELRAALDREEVGVRVPARERRGRARARA